MLKQICIQEVQVSSSMYGLLLPLDIKGLSTKEIRIEIFRSKFLKSTEFNFYFFRNPP